jgi:hypothetical protein
MSKQKTAMQQLDEFIEYNYGNCTIIGDKVKSLLKEEKQQIENSYDKGFSFGVAMLKQKQEVFVNGEKYYKSTFDNSVVS